MTSILSFTILKSVQSLTVLSNIYIRHEENQHLCLKLFFTFITTKGPIGSLAIHRWGHRVTMFAGGIFSALGLLLCAFATSIYMVFLSFGFLTG